ncbi:MAG: cobyric acid synthase, partial [Planctomycetes bacterium]|nr:cobyric acid synthase [Planctomycetota bacterium]
MNPAPHGGNLRALASSAGRRPEDILDFSASINPLGPPEWLRPLISRHVAAVVHYPDPDSSALVEAVAKRHGVPTDQVIVGNGSTEIIHVLPRILCTRRAVIPVPSYSDYLDATRSAQLMVYAHALRKPDGFALHFGALDRKLRGDELVFLGQPNNPTGLLFDPAAFGALAERHPRTIFVVDEAFADFVVGYQSLASNRPPNVVVVRSMTKFYAIPGLRLGYALADKSIAERAREKLPPWSVNVFAQAVGEQALADEDYARQTREFVATQRDRLVKELSALPGLQVYPGQANFLLVKIRWQDANAAGLAHELLREHGIAIRVCDNFEGLDARFFRVAVRTETENERLISSLASALGGRPRPSPKRKTPALMFQGTSSSAGKSILTTALCRILLQDGYRVAPFKAQNMSLNSFVTRDGGEMGRAQVVQAQACRLEPDVRMNPILLKPCTDTGAQVILMGKPVGNMNVLQYTSYKSQAFDAAKKAFDSLAAEYDVIVLEGAGSPGEVNLKARDIVNMRMARYAQAPVLLVGDIDRGGVYASFVGTMEVLAEWERALVAGFVVNKFRGDESLLGPAHDYVLRHTGKPVLGVVPYLKDLNVP